MYVLEVCTYDVNLYQSYKGWLSASNQSNNQPYKQEDRFHCWLIPMVGLAKARPNNFFTFIVFIVFIVFIYVAISLYSYILYLS